jgi:hypothetical protein
MYLLEGVKETTNRHQQDEQGVPLKSIKNSSLIIARLHKYIVSLKREGLVSSEYMPIRVYQLFFSSIYYSSLLLSSYHLLSYD